MLALVLHRSERTCRANRENFRRGNFRGQLIVGDASLEESWDTEPGREAILLDTAVSKRIHPSYDMSKIRERYPALTLARPFANPSSEIKALTTRFDRLM